MNDYALQSIVNTTRGSPDQQEQSQESLHPVAQLQKFSKIAQNRGLFFQWKGRAVEQLRGKRLGQGRQDF